MSAPVQISSAGGVWGATYVHNGGGLVISSSGALAGGLQSDNTDTSLDIQGGSISTNATVTFISAASMESLTGGIGANFSFAQGAGHTVNFTDASFGNPPASWSWNFGDGSGTSTSQNPSYTYAAAGSYTVVLTATDGSSNTSTCTISVTTA